MRTFRTFLLLALGAVPLCSAATASAAGETCGGAPATIVGSAAAELLVGTPGNDVIVGGGGADTIEAGDGDDLICAGAADGEARLEDDDEVDAGDGDDVVFPSGGGETVLGGAGDDTIESGSGDDVVRAGPGRDYVDGGPGDDFLFNASGDAFLAGGEGEDVIQVDAGATYLSGGPGADILRGGLEADYLDGGDGDDFALGQGASSGQDYYDGGAGGDRLSGSNDPEYLDGGAGADRLLGAGGDDYLDGGEGDDQLEGGAGVDFFEAGDGDDALLARDNQADTHFDCGAGADTVDADPLHDSPVVRVGCEDDSDGDGLIDDWEEFGYDTDGDGTPDLDLPGMGADKDRKDVFVRVIWLEAPDDHSHEPAAETIEEVRRAFDEAPVANPAGAADGIALHVELAGSVPEADQNRILPGCPSGSRWDWSYLDELKRSGSDPGGYLPAEEARVFHFAVIGHDAVNCEGEAIGGQSRNESDGVEREDALFAGGASDFFVTQGEASDHVVATTFMHELGHNLGLGHGGVTVSADGEVTGADHVNGKPNHLSVMNYSFSLHGIPTRVLGLLIASRLDYSRFDPTDLPDLDEREAHEPDGLGAAALSEYGSKYYCSGREGAVLIEDLSGPVDWNCNGPDDETVHDVDFTGSGSRGETAIQPHPLSTANEWDALVFNGGAVGQAGPPAILPEITDLPTAPEPSLDQLELTGVQTKLRARVRFKGPFGLRLSGRLLERESGRPVAERPVAFTLPHGRELCEATTDQAGIARCFARARAPRAIARHAVASFPGDAVFADARAPVRWEKPRRHHRRLWWWLRR